MKRNITLSLMLFASIVVWAQPETMHGFVVAGGTDGNVYAVIGQPIAYIANGGDYEIAAGLAQAQLQHKKIVAQVNYGVGYEENGFSYATNTPAGVYNDTLYSHDGEFNYDLLRTLQLTVLKAISCGEIVYDGDNNPYNTVLVARYCWTQKNLRAEHYPDGTTEVAEAKVYASDMHPDEAQNLETYGRLYTWYSAVNVAENSSAEPTTNTAGYVQGICPDGWHIPTSEEMAALRALPAEEIRSTELCGFCLILTQIQLISQHFLPVCSVLPKESS